MRSEPMTGKLQEKSVTFTDFMQLLRRTRLNKGIFIFAIGLTLFGTIGSLIVPLLTQRFIDGFEPLLTQRFIDGFDADMFSAGIIVLIISVFLLSAILDGFSYYILARVGPTLISRLREIVWDKFLTLPVSYVDRTNTGESVRRVGN